MFTSALDFGRWEIFNILILSFDKGIFDFRVTTCVAPRTFERLLIKERRKPRFIKAGARPLV